MAINMLIGGVRIGGTAVLFILLNGRIAGISGVMGGAVSAALPAFRLAGRRTTTYLGLTEAKGPPSG